MAQECSRGGASLACSKAATQPLGGCPIAQAIDRTISASGRPTKSTVIFFRSWPILLVFLAVASLPAGDLFAHVPVAASRQIVGTSHGAVSGRVTDPSGNPLPEVVVTLSGASLMVPRVTASAENGNYVAPALAPGSYTVTFEHSGFRPASIDVTVGSGFTATVDAVLQLAALAESVTVEARAAVIDRHTSVISQTLTQEQLAALPGSRSMFAVLSSTPGIQVSRFEVGGNAGDVGGLFGAYGTEGSSRPTVEGINVTQISSLGFTLDYGAFEEASVGLGALRPGVAGAGRAHAVPRQVGRERVPRYPLR